MNSNLDIADFEIKNPKCILIIISISVIIEIYILAVLNMNLFPF